MKKICKILISLFLGLLALSSLCGCNMPKKEDVIPSELGAPEGLYLYKGNTRSLTDGSETERVLKTVEINGQAYAETEYSVEDYAYMRAVHKCYFILSVGEERFLYLFDYKEKTGTTVSSLPADEKLCVVASSDCYFYVETENVHLLYDVSGTLLCDRIDGLLNGDLLYAIDEYAHTYEWFYNGEYHCVTNEQSWFFDRRYYHRFEGYAYFFKMRSTVVIDLDTGECFLPELLNDPENFPYGNQYYLHGEPNEHMYYADGTLYLLAVYYKDIPNDDTSEWHTYLYGIAGKEARVLYYFGNPRWGCNIKGVDNGNIYFQAGYDGKHYPYYSYNIASGKLKKVSKLPDFSKPSVPANYIKAGEYEFFTEIVSYTVPDGFLGFRFEDCAYLCRRKNGKKEIMQYSFKSSKFYDDICEI